MHHFLDHPAGWMPSRLADIYDETSFWSARFGALLFDHLEIHRGIRGLDVGCGTGFPLIELAHVHGTSSHFIGIDIWADALERARVKLELHGLTNVDLIEADVASMPFPNAHFDLVVSNIGINNFRVQYTAGFATVPEDVQEACAELVATYFAQRGRDMTLQAEAVPGGHSYSVPGVTIDNIPERIAALLRPYRITRVTTGQS